VPLTSSGLPAEWAGFPGASYEGISDGSILSGANFGFPGYYGFAPNITPTERAIGIYRSSAPPASTLGVGVAFRNSGVTPVYAVYVKYKGEQWFQSNSIVPSSLKVEYQVFSGAASVTALSAWTPLPALNFVGPKFGSTSGPPACISPIGTIALDGNDPANSGERELTINLPTPLAPGQSVVIRWIAENPFASCTGHGLAIDDLEVIGYALNAPTAPFVGGIECDRFRVVWTAASPTPSAYLVEVFDNPGYTGSAIFSSTVSSPTTEQLVTGLSSATTYFIRLTSIDGCNTSRPVLLSGTTAAGTRPGPSTVTGVSPVCESAGTSTLTWSGAGTPLQWQRQLGCTGPFNDIGGATGTTFTISPIVAPTRTCYRVLVGTSVCQDTSSTFTLEVQPTPPTPSITRPSVLDHCSDTLRLDASPIGPGLTGLWTQTSGPTTLSFDDITSPTTTVRGLDAGTYDLTWRVTSACGSSAPAFKRINIPALIDKGTATISAPIICNGDPITLTNTGISPGPPSIIWERDPGCTGTFFRIVPAAVLNTVTFNETATGRVCYRLEINAGVCRREYSDTLEVLSQPDPTPAFAGTDFEVCSANATVTGNTPIVGAGRWEFVSGPVSATVITSGVNGDITGMTAPGDYTFKYVIDNAPCASSEDEVIVTKTFDLIAIIIPSTPTLCSGDNLTLDATVTGGVGPFEYKWQENDVPGCAGTWNDLSPFGPSSTASFGIIAPPIGERCYRVQVRSAVCSLIESLPTRVIILKSEGGTATPTLPMICAGFTSRINLTGQRGTNIQWQEDFGCTGAYTDIIGAVTPGYDTPPLLAGNYCYRAIVREASCAAETSTIASVNVMPSLLAGTATPVAPAVCLGETATINLAGSTGAIQWQRDPACLDNWTDIIGANAATLISAPLTVATCYRAQLTGPGCFPVLSNVARVNITPAPVAGRAAASTTVSCTGTSFSLTASGAVGTGFQWQESSDCITYNNITGATGPSHVIPVVATPGNYCYRVQVTRGGCLPVFSIPVTVRIVAPPALPVAAVITTPACTGPSINTYSVLPDPNVATYDWTGIPARASIVSGLGTPSIGVVFGTATPGSYTLQVRARNFCGVSPALDMSYVLDGTVGGRATASSTIVCAGSSTTLNVVDAVGSTYQWQEGPTASGPFTDIVGAVSATFITPALATNVWFRVRVSTGSCATSESLPVEVRVSTPPSAGILSGPGSPLCSGTNSSVINLSAFTGTIERWESSSDGFFTFDSIANNTPLLSVLNLTRTTAYRVVIGSPSCASVTSTSFTINIISGSGIISPARVDACGSASSGVLTISGLAPLATIVRWERSNDCVGFSSPVSIPNTTTTLAYSTLSTTTCYRAIVNNGTCLGSTSTVGQILVSPSTISGTVSTSTTSVCASGNSGTITLSGNRGRILGWESSTNGFVTTTTIANTSTVLNFTDITTTTRYRARVKNGACPSIATAPVEVRVFATPVGGSLTAASRTYCGSGSDVLILSGQSGNIVRWESSTDDFITSTPIVNTLTFLSFTGVTATTQFRAVVGRAGVCPVVFSAPARAVISPASVGGTVASDQTVCGTSNFGSLTLSGQVGDVVRWESSTNDFITVNTIASTLPFYSFVDLPTTTRIRAVVKNGTCSEAISSAVRITVIPDALPGILNTSQTFCSATNSGTLQLVGHTGAILRWESSSDGFISNTPIANVTPILNFVNLPITTEFRVVLSSNPLCPEIFSTIARITVRTGPVGGIATPADTIICNGTSTNILLSGHVGPIARWQSSDGGCTGPWTNIPIVAPIISTGALTMTKCYRAQVNIAGCGSVNSTTALVRVSRPAITMVTTRPEGCFSAADGQIEVSASGTIGALEYTISDFINVQASNVFTGLTRGTYTVKVRDASANSCIAMQTAVVGGASAALAVTGTVNPVSCSGLSDGRVDIRVTGGTAPYRFVWSNGSSSEDIFGLATGPYAVTVTDAAGCVVNQSFAVNATTVITVSPIVNNVTCFGGRNGFVFLNVSGGTGAPTYRWFDGLATQSRNDLPAGSHCVTVTDAGCTVPVCVTVTQPAALTLNFSPTNVVCPGDGTGAVDLTAVGGTPPYISYRWNTGAASEDLSLLNAGIYSVTVTDNNRCVQTGSIPVIATSPGPGTPSFLPFVRDYCGPASVTLTVNPLVGALFNWYTVPTGGSTFFTGTSTTVSPIVGDTTRYYVEAVDALSPGCRSVRVETYIVSSRPTVAGTLGPDASFCSTTNSGNINLIGKTGNVIRWETSTDNFATITALVTSATTFSFTNVPVTTKFRAIVKSGICATETTNVATVTINIGACPELIVSPATLAFGAIPAACGGVVTQTYNLTGRNLTGPALISPPTGFEISLSVGGPFSSFAISIAPDPLGNISIRPIFVRLLAGSPAGSYFGSINNESTGASAKLVSLSATVVPAATPFLSATTIGVNFGRVIVGRTSAVISYDIALDYLVTSPATVNVPAPFEISTSASGPFGSSLSFVTDACSSIVKRIYVRFRPTSITPFSAVINHNAGAIVLNIPATGEGAPIPTVTSTFVNDPWNGQADVDATFGPGVRTWKTDAFNNLQEAIDNTATGGKVTILNGAQFSDNSVIDRPMTITGSGSGTVIGPRNLVANTFPPVNPGDALNASFSFNHALIIQADEVTIENLTINGGAANPCERRFGVGIITDSRTGVAYRDIQIRNVGIENVYAKGIQIHNTGDLHRLTNVRVNDVCLRFNPDSATYTNASGIYTNDPTIITNAIVQNTGTGIQAIGEFGSGSRTSVIENSSVQLSQASGILLAPSVPAFGANVRVRNNAISGVGRAGIDARNLGASAMIGGMTPADGNTITVATVAGRRPAVGMQLTYSAGLNVYHNNVNANGLESGITLFHNVDPANRINLYYNNLTATGSVAGSIGQSAGYFFSDRGTFHGGPNGEVFAQLVGGKVTGFNIGFYTNENALNDVDVIVGLDAPSPDDHATFDNNFMGMMVNGRSAVRVKKNAKSIKNSDVGIFVFSGEAEIFENSFINNRIAILVRDKPGFTALPTIVKIRDNRFIGSRDFNIRNESASLVDASFNWFGTADRAAVIASIFGGPGGVDYSPWVNADVDVDGSLNNGFQPVKSTLYVDAASPRATPLGHISEAVIEPAANNIVIYDGTYPENVNVTRNISFTSDAGTVQPIIQNLTLNGTGANLTLNDNFTISNGLTLTDGKVIASGTNTLTLQVGATASTGNDNSYVIGRLGRQKSTTASSALYYPIGTSTAFRPATLTTGQSTTALMNYVGFMVEPNPSIGLSLPSSLTAVTSLRSYQFDAVGSAAITTASLQISYGASELGTSPASDVAVANVTPAGIVWQNMGGTGVGSPSGTVTSTVGLTSLGTFAVGFRTTTGGGGPEPVITSVSSITTTSAIIRWTMPAVCSSFFSTVYDFRYRVKGSTTWLTITDILTNVRNFTSLLPNTVYEIAVRARCGTITTGYSTTTITEFRTLSAGTCATAGFSVPIPGGVFVDNVTSNTARLNWSLTTDIPTQGYIVSYGPLALSMISWTQVTVCHPNTSFVMRGLVPGRPYGVRIRTNCSNCTTALDITDRRSAFSTPINFTTLTIREGVETANAAGALGIYPNPNNGNFMVRLVSESASNGTIRLFDLAGKAVFAQPVAVTAGENELPIAIEGFAPGIYLLEFMQGELRLQTKVIVE
jgi:hypothetical protein